MQDLSYALWERAAGVSLNAQTAAVALPRRNGRPIQGLLAGGLAAVVRSASRVAAGREVPQLAVPQRIRPVAPLEAGRQPGTQPASIRKKPQEGAGGR